MVADTDLVSALPLVGAAEAVAPRRLGGAGKRRWAGAAASYSTEVLRGTRLVRVEPDAQEALGVVMSLTAWWKAEAMLTEVSLTDHFSGLVVSGSS